MTDAWLSAGAAAAITNEATQRHPHETGGLLLGYVAPNGEPVVLDIIRPGPAAHHERDSFTPDHTWQVNQLKSQYVGSDGVLSYLGDWHSHPAGGPAPSRRDLATLSSIATDPAARAPRPLMGIVGLIDGAFQLQLWRWSPLTLGPWTIRARATSLNWNTAIIGP